MKTRDATNFAIQCMRCAAEDYICKPFNLDEVAINADKTLEKIDWNKRLKNFRNIFPVRLDCGQRFLEN